MTFCTRAAITHYHKRTHFSIYVHVVQKITIIRAQKIGKSAVWNFILYSGHSIECIIHVGHSIAFNMFLHFVTLWPWSLTFWPNIKWVARTHDGPSGGKFGDCSFRQFDFIIFNMFLHFVTLWPWPLTFWPNINNGWWLMMDYPRSKFGDCSFSRFGFIVRTDRQNHRITHRHGWSLYSRDGLPQSWSWVGSIHGLGCWVGLGQIFLIFVGLSQVGWRLDCVIFLTSWNTLLSVNEHCSWIITFIDSWLVECRVNKLNIG